MQEPRSLDATAERHIRPELQQAFRDLCTQPVSHYLARFGFRSGLVQAMYATTDGFSGLSGGWDTPGTGLNFLAHNMCCLDGAAGTWMVVTGGMGSVTQQLALRAAEAGALVATDSRVAQVTTDSDGVATGVRVVVPGGQERAIAAKAVMVNGDPWRLRQLLPEAAVPAPLEATLEKLKMDGMTMKVLNATVCFLSFLTGDLWLTVAVPLFASCRAR